jgi:hypothetical protein
MGACPIADNAPIFNQHGLESASKLGAKTESDIKETTFKVRIKDGKPEVTVEKVELVKPEPRTFNLWKR